MRSFEIIPTEENLIQALQEDLLKRNKDIVSFYDLLMTQEMSTSIAIDGRWGSGKTFFVKQTMLVINAKNISSEMDEDKRLSITCGLPFANKEEEMSDNCDLAVYYDAWENDNDDDPILSLVYGIIKQLGIDYDLARSGDIYKLAGSIMEMFSGRNINSIIENLKGENPLAKIEEGRALYQDISLFFTEILKERGNRLVIFVDELDRCKPSYAVRLLERIKHYLDDDRITFVFSVNLEELQHTVKRYYGSTFDACRYLDRFFDLHISLPPADYRGFYNKMGLDTASVLEKVCHKIISVYNMEMREITRFYRQVKTAVYEPTHGSEKWDFSYANGNGKKLMLLYIVPIVVGLKIVNVSLWGEFINGKNVKPLMEVYKDSEVGEWLSERLLNRDETYEVVEGVKLVTVEQKIQELYDAIFVTEYTGRVYHTVLGNCEFNSGSKDFVETVASMLSEYADYHV